MTAILSPSLIFQGLGFGGFPLPGGKLYSYIAGTSTPQTTYVDSTETTPNANPVILNANGQALVWLDPTLVYKFKLTDALGNQIYVTDQVQGSLTAAALTTILTQAYLGAILNPQTPAEAAAGVTPTNYQYATQPYDIRRYGALLNDSHDDTTALNTAITVAGEVVNGAQGNAVFVSTGVSLLSSEVTLPNRVRVLGINKRGSYFQAVPTWNVSGNAWMFHAFNGTSSMFDSTLENITIDCNGIAGLGGILSDAWQDDCGLRGVLITNFTTSAIKFQNGYGGGDYCKIIDTEIFGNSIGGGTANSIGVDLTSPMGSAAAFKLDIQSSVIVGGAQNLASGVSLATTLSSTTNAGNSLMARGLHFETATVGVIVDGNGFVDLEDLDGSSTVTTLVQINAGFSGTLIMRNCRRNGTTNFLVDNRVAQIQQFDTITGGSLYTNGVYSGVPLTGGSGTGATAAITVSGAAVTAVGIQNPGTNYAVGDTLSASAANIGGSGSGFSIPVFQIFTGYGTLSGYDEPFFITKYGNSENIKQIGGASAWCSFDGTVTGTAAPAAGFNVKSVTRNSAGNYTITLVRPMLSANAAPVASCGSTGPIVATQLIGTTSFKVLITSTGGTPTDSNEVKAICFGG